MEELLSTEAAAEYLGVSVVALRRAVRKKRVPITLQKGGNGRKAFRFDKAHLDAYRERWANQDENMLAVGTIASKYKVTYGRVREAIRRHKLAVACNDGRSQLYRPADIAWLAEQERW